MLRRNSIAVALSAGAVLAVANVSAISADFYWACGSENWNSICWSSTAGGAATLPPSLGGAPFGKHNFFLYNSGPEDVTVTVAEDADLRRCQS
jgi:hypothetical protein